MGPRRAASPSAGARSSLPAAVGSWRATGADAVFTPDTLHLYIDGSAELYLSYGFLHLTSRRFVREAGGEPTITLDVFDLQNAEDAFGLFAHGREGTADESAPPAIGQDAVQIGGLLSFWKGRHYVSIQAYPETAEALAVLPALARAVSDSIRDEGLRPALVEALPAAGLMPASVRFFRHPVWLNIYGFVSDENILDLGPQRGAAMARYRTADGASTLVLVDYPNEAGAARAEERVRHALFQGERGDVSRTAEGQWAGVTRARRRLALVLRAPTAARARLQLAAAVAEPGGESTHEEAR